MTPIQQVAAVSAAVNGGTLYTPYIAKEWIDPVTKQTVKKQTPIAKRKVISEEASKQIRYALESVVAQGRGGTLCRRLPGGRQNRYGAKSQGREIFKNNHIVSFIGTAPSDDPSIVVYVAVDNPKGTIQFGVQLQRRSSETS